MVQCDHHHFGSHRSFCQHLQPRSVDQKTQEFNVLQAVEGKYHVSQQVLNTFYKQYQNLTICEKIREIVLTF